MQHKEWVADVFNRAAPEYGEKGCDYFDHFGKKLVAYTSPCKGDRILDVATGTGAVLLPAARAVGPQGSVIGVDLSLGMLQEAKKRSLFPWIQLQQMDAEHLEFPDNSFDVVFCAHALFFFPNILRALTEFKRVLKPHGRLSISIFGKRTPLNAWIVERSKELGATRQIRVTAIEDAEMLKDFLQKAGFSQIDIHEEKTMISYETSEEWWESLWTCGYRSNLEQLLPQDLELLKKEALVRAGREGIAQDLGAFFSVAEKSA